MNGLMVKDLGNLYKVIDLGLITTNILKELET